MRLILLLIAVIMVWRTYQVMRKDPKVVHSVRLGFWLTMIAWVLTRVPVLGYLAAGLLALSVLGWIAPGLLPRRKKSEGTLDTDGQPLGDFAPLSEALETLPEAKQIAGLPEAQVYPYLQRPEAPIRLAAAERLRTVATPENANRIVELLHGSRREIDEDVRLKLALVLARWNRSESLPVLAGALKADRSGRWDALTALVHLDARQYVPEILTLAAHEPRPIGTANAIHAAIRLGGGEDLMQPRARKLVRRYVRGAGDLLPTAWEDVRAVAELLKASHDPEQCELGDRLDRLLQFTEDSEVHRDDQE
jgi:hypothetical protein